MQDVSATVWLADFGSRLEQLSAVADCENFQRFLLWFGGLFFPEAFLTASRQAIAQKKGLSLEELQMVVTVGNTSHDDESFMVKGLQMESAAWDSEAAGGSGQLVTTDELSVALPTTRLKWVHRESAELQATKDYLRLPVYLNMQRNLLITDFKLPFPKEVPQAIWYNRSACLTLWTKQ